MTTSPSVNRRFLALWLPFLPTDRLRRMARRSGAAPAEGLPAPPDGPLVVAARRGGAMRLVASDAAARRLGLHPGLSLADARARLGALAVAPHDPEADRRFLERIADACDRYTPLVALDGEDGLVLDISGAAHLSGGEAALKRDLEARLAGIGVACRSAVAGTPEAARALARFGRDGEPGNGDAGIVPPGGEAAALASLPAAALGLDHGECVALARLGLKTVGAIDARPRAGLAARFGERLIERLDAALGRRERPIVPHRPVPAFCAERRFAEPIGRIEDCGAAIERLAGDLERLLEGRNKGGRQFEASFFRADGAVRRVGVLTAAPLRSAGALCRLLFRRLDAVPDPLDPGFGFDAIRLAVLVVEEMVPVQPGLAGPAGAEVQASAALADRLGARFGAEALVRFEPLDSHVPERAVRLVPILRELDAGAEARGDGGWVLAPASPEPSGEPPERPLRLFEPPQPIEAIAEVPDGPPRQFRWRRVLHVVVSAEGPERIAAEWWREAEGEAVPTRDYFRVEDRRGLRFWLFREGLFGAETDRPRWFVHGLFA